MRIEVCDICGKQGDAKGLFDLAPTLYESGVVIPTDLHNMEVCLACRNRFRSSLKDAVGRVISGWNDSLAINRGLAVHVMEWPSQAQADAQLAADMRPAQDTGIEGLSGPDQEPIEPLVLSTAERLVAAFKAGLACPPERYEAEDWQDDAANEHPK